MSKLAESAHEWQEPGCEGDEHYDRKYDWPRPLSAQRKHDRKDQTDSRAGVADDLEQSWITARTSALMVGCVFRRHQPPKA
jgi:hypothetical protein